jgi:sirohydrochlorin ferrochelatase
MSPASQLAERLRQLCGEDASELGVVIVDHGSKRGESNDLLLEVVNLFRRLTGLGIVEPAHMELAEPSIGDAFDRAVEAGARTIVVLPYFLGPGRHWSEDIPRLADEAAARHEGVCHTLAKPLGLHPALIDVLAERTLESLRS